jgi:DNA-binding CsgD family transcriptional regulator
MERAVDPQWTAPAAELRAELSIWEDRPRDAARAVDEGLDTFERLSVIAAGQVSRIGPLFSLGVRSAADLAALARVRHADAQVRTQIERGRTYCQRMRAVDDEVRVRLEPMVPLSEAWLALCDAEETRLEGASDPAAWVAAAAAFRRQGMLPLLAYSLWRQADASLALSRARVAVAPLLRAAATLVRDMGAEPLLVRVEALAAHARIDLAEAQSTPTEAAQADRFGLTSREREVLELVALGRTNRQIAATLFITEKIAGAHVSNILGKLDAGGRTEAAAIARRFGLVADRASA